MRVRSRAHLGGLLFVRRGAGGDPGLELVELVLGEAANRVLLLELGRGHLLSRDLADNETLVRLARNDCRTGFPALQQTRPCPQVESSALHTAAMADETF